MIFLAFANDANRPLPTLKREEEEVHRLLSTRMAKQHFNLHCDPHCNLAKLAEYLIRFRGQLSVFLFSGHANRDQLILQDQAANSQGIAELLGQCPNLKLVILNGCATAGQVKSLLELPNKPAVIATSAPVEDAAATQFSISFFQSLSEHHATLAEAFQLGLAAAKTASAQPIAGMLSRNLALPTTPTAPVWVLRMPEGMEDLLEWKLPAKPRPVEVNDIQPNQYLLKGLLDSLAVFDMRAKEVILNKVQTARIPGRRRLKKGDNQRRNVILKCLPLPISEQVARLVTKQRANDHTFYDSYSYDRLKQLLLTYDVAMELPVFILLAQLFDLLAKEDVSLRITATQAQAIQGFLQLTYADHIQEMYTHIIGVILEVLSANKRDLFVPELAVFGEQTDGDFQNAFQALELKKQRLNQMKNWDLSQITEECIEAEEMLTQVLSKLCFLTNYSLVSVRNIDVLRNRLFRTPSFVHRVVHLAKKDDSAPEEVEELLDDFLENESVLLMKKQPLTGATAFLNLTPFVIDENAYVKKAENIKLHFFHHYQEATQTYFFKHTYKPDDPLLEVLDRETEEEAELAIQDVWEQFEDFRKLVQAAAL